MSSMASPLRPRLFAAFARCFAVFLAMFFLLSPARAADAPLFPDAPDKSVLSYGVYVGGIQFLQGGLQLGFDKQKYFISGKAATRGFWGNIVPWQTESNAEGQFGKTGLLPQRHEVISTWRGQSRSVELLWDKKRQMKASATPPAQDDDRDPVEPALLQKAVDPMSGVLELLMHADWQNGCNGVVPVFDGRRRFDIGLVDYGTETIEKQDFTYYGGATRKCALDFTLIAGGKKKEDAKGFWAKQDGKNKRPPIYVWLAQVAPGLPLMPVKIETQSSYGAVMVHLLDFSAAKLPPRKKAATTTETGAQTASLASLLLADKTSPATVAVK